MFCHRKKQKSLNLWSRLGESQLLCGRSFQALCLFAVCSRSRLAGSSGTWDAAPTPQAPGTHKRERVGKPSLYLMCQICRVRDGLNAEVRELCVPALSIKKYSLSRCLWLLTDTRTAFNTEQSSDELSFREASVFMIARWSYATHK